jgi:hypothetical protein
MVRQAHHEEKGNPHPELVEGRGFLMVRQAHHEEKGILILSLTKDDKLTMRKK